MEHKPPQTASAEGHEIQSMGGKARANSLSPSARTAIARRAAEARWGSDLSYATHDGTLDIAGRIIACANLNTRKRVLTQESFLTSIGRAAKAKAGTGVFSAKDGVDDLPAFLSAENLKPFLSDELRQSTTPIIYRALNGAKAMGYDAMLLPMVCDVYIRAGLARKLTKSQRHIAETCNVLVQGWARVGIIALVDDATGYSEDRASDELAKILEAYVLPEFRKWIPKFPPEFFRQVYRLQGWEYRPGTAKRSQYVGKLINKYIYGAFPPGVLDELRRLNPVTEKGYRMHKHSQFLTPNTGHEHLDAQISHVTMLMRASTSKEQFEELFGRAFPILMQQQLLPLDQPRPTLKVEVGTQLKLFDTGGEPIARNAAING